MRSCLQTRVNLVFFNANLFILRVFSTIIPCVLKYATICVIVYCNVVYVYSHAFNLSDEIIK